MRQIGLGTFAPSPRARELVNSVLDTGRISYGPLSHSFETKFAALHTDGNTPTHAILANSGTDALRIALHALKEYLGWKDGDEVIVPAVTFVASVNVVLQLNLVPKLVDVDATHYLLNPSLLFSALTPHTRCILPVHLFGQPAPMTAISQFADTHDLSLLEDSCECMFVTHANKPVGTWGNMAAFSTYVAHLITTGVGGIITTQNKDLAQLARSLANHGRDGIYLNVDDDGSVTEEIINRRFRFPYVGYSSRITELEAALGIAALDEWEENLATRKSNAILLKSLLSKWEHYLSLPYAAPNNTHSWMMFALSTRNEPKHALVTWLEHNGVETRDAMPLITQPCYREMKWDLRRNPVAAWLDRAGFYVGCHPGLGEADMDYVADLFDAYFEGKATT